MRSFRALMPGTLGLAPRRADLRVRPTVGRNATRLLARGSRRPHEEMRRPIATRRTPFKTCRTVPVLTLPCAAAPVWSALRPCHGIHPRLGSSVFTQPGRAQSNNLDSSYSGSNRSVPSGPCVNTASSSVRSSGDHTSSRGRSTACAVSWPQ